MKNKIILFSFLLFSILNSFAQGVKISALPLHDSVASGGYVPLVINGVTKRVLADSIAVMSLQGLDDVLSHNQPFTFGRNINLNKKGLTLDSASLLINGYNGTLVGNSLIVGNYGDFEVRSLNGAGNTWISRFKIDAYGNKVGVHVPNTSDLLIYNPDSNSRVGINTRFPSEALHVKGSIRMVDGNQAAGYILKSDANGKASWTAPKYKIYTALLTQASTSAPSAVALENTLLDPVSITRQSTGTYWFESDDFDDLDKVHIMLPSILKINPGPNTIIILEMSWISSPPHNTLQIMSYSFNPIANTEILVDGLLDRTSIEIKVLQ